MLIDHQTVTVVAKDVVAKETLNACSISLSGSYSSFEFLVVQLTVKTGRLNFVWMYRPPQTSSFFDDLRNFLDEVVELPGTSTSATT